MDDASDWDKAKLVESKSADLIGQSKDANNITDVECRALLPVGESFCVIPVLWMILRC